METLHKQYTIVKRETNTSHVMQYGDKVSNRMFDSTTVSQSKICFCLLGALRATLVVAFGICLKILEGSKELWMLFCHFMTAG